MKRFIPRLRLCWVLFWACMATVILVIPVTVASFVGRKGSLAFHLMGLWAWIVRKASGVRVQITGREKLRGCRNRRFIIVSNHQSLYDIPALMALNLQLRWIVKKELFWIPIFGLGAYLARNIFIDRSNRKKAIKQLHEGVDRLPPGVNVMFFPEGTRSMDGRINPFKKGAFALAIAKNLPILPVTVNGSRKILPKKEIYPRPGVIQVVVGDPIETDGYTHEDLNLLLENTRAVIISNFKPAAEAPLPASAPP